MSNNDELKKIIDNEKEYNRLFNEFKNSNEDKIFSKSEVKKIIEAHMYKEFLGKKEHKNKQRFKKIIISPSLNLISRQAITNFFLSYLFYVGFLVIITNYLYGGLITNKYSVFIIALAFTMIDRFIKPLLFFFDFISITIHKIGLLILTVYTLIFFILANVLNNSGITIEKSVIVAVIVLVLVFILDMIKRESLFKTKYISNEIGSDEDE